MKCSKCGCVESKVTDSRQTEDGLKIRRRRECLSCGARFTTYEIKETISLTVIKRDKSRQPFNSQKLIEGLMRACEKRPVSIETLEKLVSDIEISCTNEFVKEISTKTLGDKVMSKLQEIDQVAYVRFASVYKEFADIDTFLDELMKLKNKE